MCVCVYINTTNGLACTKFNLTSSANVHRTIFVLAYTRQLSMYGLQNDCVSHAEVVLVSCYSYPR